MHVAVSISVTVPFVIALAHVDGEGTPIVDGDATAHCIGLKRQLRHEPIIGDPCVCIREREPSRAGS
jgi:hypothetical protein